MASRSADWSTVITLIDTLLLTSHGYLFSDFCGWHLVMSKSFSYYRPAAKLRQGNVFTGVCDSVHTGGVPHTPRTRYTPLDQTHPPRTRYTPLGPGTPPCRIACSEIRSTRGWYASYWNAFLFEINFRTTH